MSDASILITAKDQYSDSLKKMQNATKLFGRDVDTMQKKLDAVNKQKYELKWDLRKHTAELKDMEKQMRKNGEVSDEFRKRYDAAQESVDGLKSKIALLSAEAKNTEKQMRSLAQSGQDTAEAFGEGQSGSGTGLTSVMKNLGQAGLFNQLGGALSGAAGQQLTSLYGEQTASAIQSVLSGAVNGASIGSLGGIGWGTAIGAGVGAIAGGIEAATAKAGKNDDLYRDYVSDQYNTWRDTQQQTLAEGTGIAAGRETDMLSFTTLLHGKENADRLLSDLTDFAAKTPFGYEDMTSASKTLLSYKVSQDKIVEYMTALGDAGSAVGLGGADISRLSTYLGRIKSGGKATMEYLNPLQEAGIDVYGMLAEDIGISIAELKEQISKGNVNGERTVEVLIAKMEEQFGGSMEAMSSTYSGLQSTLEDTKAQLSAAEGAAYNEERKSGSGGMEEQLAWYEEHMQELEEAYSAMGAYQASLENERDKARMESMDTVMASDEYKQAAAEKDGAMMGKLFAEAQAKAQNEYLNSDAYAEYEKTQIDIVEMLQGEAAISEAWKMYGNHVAQKMSEGIKSGLASGRAFALPPETSSVNDNLEANGASGIEQMRRQVYGPGNASGLNRVPYDNYPTILHEGERVLTAREVRAQERSPGLSGVSVTIQNCTVRQDSDIDAIAEQLYDKLLAASKGMM